MFEPLEEDLTRNILTPLFFIDLHNQDWFSLLVEVDAVHF